MQNVQPRFQIGDKICLDPDFPGKIGELIYRKFQTEHYATVTHIFRNHFEYTGSPYLINFYFDSEPTRIHQCYLETRFALYIPRKKIENADLLGLILKGATP